MSTMVQHPGSIPPREGDLGAVDTGDVGSGDVGKGDVGAGAERWLDTHHPGTAAEQGTPNVDVPPQPLKHPIDTDTAGAPEA